MKKTILLALSFILYFTASTQQVRINIDSIAKLLSGNTRFGMFSQLKKEINLGLENCLKVTNNTPFYIVDGDPEIESEVEKFDIAEIESINVLKEVSKVYCFKSHQSVIIITSKKADRRVINIKDAESGEALPGATVELISGGSKIDTVRFVASTKGDIITSKTLLDGSIEIRVSMIGYKTFSSSIHSSIKKNNSVISLQRNHFKLKEVVISSGTMRILRCGLPGRSITHVRDALDPPEMKLLADNFRIFPNPVMRSQHIKIQFESGNLEKLSVRLFSLDGKLVSTAEYCPVIGLNRISFPIHNSAAAGLYSIQLIDQFGRMIKTEKLIIQ